ncbi:hypothetical protein [Aestuariicoccus sp. MJ-SS9]|uniref:hypothetical protein n=1 Tax=Aestuariicoccus sp. MJ-SS9 TaxID=3079855 RepID=UPI0029086A7C|nr:hypothetical protein [Aestuariicoccus sp. MJ-SS9]MDU8913774.1 hypothetical protein [Aestuariicoccus sp. MJ-SS9]
MRHIRISALAFAACLGLGIAGAPVMAQQLPSEIPVTEGFKDSKIGLPGNAGHLTIYGAIIGKGQNLAFCGVAVPSRSAVSRHINTILQKMSLKEGNKKVVRSLTFMPHLKSGTSPIGAMAKCKPFKKSGDGQLSLDLDPTYLRM